MTPKEPGQEKPLDQSKPTPQDLPKRVSDQDPDDYVEEAALRGLRQGIEDRKKRLAQNDPLNNQHPLNQEAKRWLKVAGADADPTASYLFQLMRWGLDEGKVVLKNQAYKDILSQQVDGLLGDAHPKEALAYLCQNREEPEFPLLEVEDLQRSMSPGRAAKRALEALDERLKQDPNLRGTYPPSPG